MSPPDPTPKRRRWFQLHLSTAVVLMFVAGGLIYLNRWKDVHLDPSGPFGAEPELVAYQERGWPQACWVTNSPKAACGVPDRVELGALVIDILVAGIALASTWRLAEYTIRRRETRKP